METAVPFLKRELEKRIRKNPSYSMRSFAASLGLNIGTLSGLMSGKRPLSAKVAVQLCEKLQYGPRESAKILEGVYREHQKKHLGHVLTAREVQESELEQDKFTVIADWYHYAILQLVHTDEYASSPRHSDPKWVAQQLSITASQAKLALDRLVEVGLLRRIPSGLYERTEAALTTQNKTRTSSALIRHQEQMRLKAIESLKNDPIETRLMRSMTMAIDPARLPEAAELMEEFQNELSELIEKKPRKQVYQLTLSLFPLQKRRSTP